MESINKEFLCPITNQIMKDPVIASDNKTYERAAFVGWVASNKKSPVTDEELVPDMLRPNEELKARIQAYLNPKEEQKVASAASAGLDLQIFTASYKDQGIVHLSVVPPKTGPRKSMAFVCVIDISGSMASSASIQKGGESDCFSRLDLVKHSVKTIINILDVQDYVSIVSFTDYAKVELPLTKMDSTGKAEAEKQLDKLQPDCSTNLYDGLKVGIETVRKSKDIHNSNTSILLFTDGQSNVNPPGGVIPTLTDFIKEEQTKYTIHTFGYGYSLDSDLLLQISHVGFGNYNYIPDCTMVGTIFVNYLSNSLSTLVDQAEIQVTSSISAELKCLGYPMTNGVIKTGYIQYGQNRDFILDFPLKGNESINVSAILVYNDGKTRISKTLSGIQSEPNPTTLCQYARCLYIKKLGDIMTDFLNVENNAKNLKALLGLLSEMPCAKDKLVEGLIHDIHSDNKEEGQLGKALQSKEYLDKWGVYYSRSLLRAHQLQQCHNFKDPGVQNYGGSDFKEWQNKADTVFCSLPPPKPSIVQAPKPVYTASKKGATSASRGSKVQSYAAAPPPKPSKASMREYLNRCSGCFDGEGQVTLNSGECSAIKNLKKGDRILTKDKREATVLCLVQYTVNQEIEVVNLNGVFLTPWHPVLVAGKWKFPAEIKAPEIRFMDYIYNLVLDKTHIADINGLEVVTLAHGLKEAVVAHPYFGSNRILEDLKNFGGYEAGKVSVPHCTVIRDESTGLISALH